MKKSHIIGIVIIAVSIGAILSTMVDAGTYVTFSEASENPDREFHVVGTLNHDKELIYNPEENPDLFSFFLLDKDGEERKVNFSGAKPQDFERSEQVVIIGKAANDEFSASRILMKCPSKYNAEGETEMREFTAGTRPPSPKESASRKD